MNPINQKAVKITRCCCTLDMTCKISGKKFWLKYAEKIWNKTHTKKRKTIQPVTIRGKK